MRVPIKDHNGCVYSENTSSVSERKRVIEVSGETEWGLTHHACCCQGVIVTIHVLMSYCCIVGSED